MRDPFHWNGCRTSEQLRLHAKEGSDPGMDPSSEPLLEHFRCSHLNRFEIASELFRERFRVSGERGSEQLCLNIIYE